MKYNVIIVLALIISSFAYSQDPKRFETEISELSNKINEIKGDSVYLFTGSSSIRGWHGLENRFSDKTIVNAGFGGSHMSDLLFYYDELIKPLDPMKIFIYEGDNDIAGGKQPNAILKDAKKLVSKIERDFPNAQIYFISAKPSISRWHLKREYQTFNEKLERYTTKYSHLYFIDVWPSMLNDQNQPKAEIFVEDDLHMNRDGYKLWEEIISEYL